MFLKSSFEAGSELMLICNLIKRMRSLTIASHASGYTLDEFAVKAQELADTVLGFISGKGVAKVSPYVSALVMDTVSSMLARSALDGNDIMKSEVALGGALSLHKTGVEVMRFKVVGGM